MTPPRIDDFADRELCPDGACIGVIGPDGRCKECGAAGTPRARDARHDEDEAEAEAEDQAETEDQAEADDETDDETETEDEAETDHDDEDDALVARALCLDDTCIGLIGPDGVCRECGKPGPQLSLDPRARGLRSDEEVADELAANIATSTIPRADPDFDQRTLCADEACIGVVGRDGRCRVCGTAV